MKSIIYQGTSPVDIDGYENVQPGDTVEVPDAQAAALLSAGTSYSDPDENGNVTVTPPEDPLWAPADVKKSKKVATAAVTDTAEAGKDQA